jgi:phage-related protein
VVNPRVEFLVSSSLDVAMCLVEEDAIVILGVFQKKTTKTPQRVIDACRQRLRDYDAG